VKWSGEKLVNSLAMATLRPFIQIWSAYLYAGTKNGALAKAGMFATFIPVIVLSVVVWAAGWTFVLYGAVLLLRQ
jgi:hypothetical protein